MVLETEKVCLVLVFQLRHSGKAFEQRLEYSEGTAIRRSDLRRDCFTLLLVLLSQGLSHGHFCKVAHATLCKY